MKGFSWSLQKSYKQISDLELAEKFRTSENQACIGEFFNRYHHLVFGLCMQYLKNTEAAKDATLEIFEKLPALLLKHQPQSFSSWLYIISKNYCLMQLRTKSAKPGGRELSAQLEQIGQEEEELNLPKMREQAYEKLEQAILLLSPEQQVCIQLFYFDQFNYQEISGQTGYTLKSVKSHLQNARRNLKITLSDLYI